MDKTNADGSSNSAADCQAQAEKVDDELSLNDDQLEAKKQAEKENENETSQFSDEETKDINADVGRKDYGGDKGQIQVWSVDGDNHLGTFPKDKTKGFVKNTNWFDPAMEKDIKDIRKGT